MHVIAIIGGLLVVIGVIAVALGFHNQKLASRTTSWPMAQGAVDYSKVAEETAVDGGKTFRLQLQYSYHVNNVKYKGDRVGYGSVEISEDPDEPAIYAERYPSQSPVNVYYNPEDPGDSVLERKPAAGTFRLFWIGAGSVFTGFGLMYGDLAGLIPTPWTNS